MARKSKAFVLSKNTPPHLRVYMSEGFKLADNPSRQQLQDACTIGGRVGRRKNGRRVKCASRIGPARRWTTAEAWDIYQEELNGDA